jgi:hypothetical protein
VKANGDINTEEKALSEFQLCRSSLEPSLQTAMDDPVASAVRALAGYLAAKVLCDERTPQDSSRGGTALEILDDASRYIRKATDSTWDQAIPGDLRKEFQTPASVGQKIENLRNALKGPAGPPPASSPPEEGHYRVGG